MNKKRKKELAMDHKILKHEIKTTTTTTTTRSNKNGNK